MQIRGTSAHQKVALLAEGVDRNLFPFRLFAVTAKVALLAEGVDRNLIRHMGLMSVLVALLAEGVDRNCKLWAFLRYWYGRPPRGGRG